jgi:tetratricopeptide (TPR) repeat protein
MMKVNQVLERLNLSFNDLPANEEKAGENIFTNALDAARLQNDYTAMAKILEAHQGSMKVSSNKFQLYVKWHGGLVSFHRKSYETSVTQLRHAIYIADKHRLSSYLPHLYIALGDTKHHLGEKSLKYYADADQLYRKLKIDDFRLGTKILYHLIACHSNEGRHHQVILKCKKAINLLSRNFSSYMMCEIYDLWLKALAGLGEEERYSDLRQQSRIIFEQHSRLEMWEKSENYPVVNS